MSLLARLFGQRASVERLRSSRDVSGLLRALRGRDWERQVEAAEALGELGDSAAVEPLVRLLQQPDAGRSVHCAVVAALAKLGDPRAIAPVVRTLGTDMWTVYDCMAEAIAPFGTAIIRPLLSALREHPDDPNVAWGVRGVLEAILTREGAAVAANELREIAQLPDVRGPGYQYQDSYFLEHNREKVLLTIDFSDPRSMASEELKRRQLE